LFDDIHSFFEQRSQDLAINATPFELLTATAYEIFRHEKVQCAVIECGMGGGRDATNGVLSSVMPAMGSKGKAMGTGEDLKACAVITKVGLDHQEFLGNTLREIALEKCGIFTPGSKVVYDETNSPEVIRVIRHATRAKQMWPIAPNFHYWPHLDPPDYNQPDVASVFEKRFAGEPHMLANARVAYNVLVNVWPIFRKDSRLNHGSLAESIARTQLMGRMQPIRLGPITGTDDIAWLDGAHNRQAMEAVGPVFAAKRRGFADMEGKADSDVPVTWVLAFSDGKHPGELLEPLDIRPGDRIAAVEFGPVDGMPWKHPLWSWKITDHVKEQYPDVEVVQFQAGNDELTKALKWATKWPSGEKGAVICTGSLYLASDVLRLLRDRKATQEKYLGITTKTW
jgi:dihydrofolate synthase